MNKKSQAQLLLNPKTISFVIGGALLGFFVFRTIKAAIIGGVIGFAISFIR